MNCDRIKHSVVLRMTVGLLGMMFFIAGCAAVISKELRESLDPELTFKTVFADPNSYTGKMVLWGGEIIQTRNMQDGSWIELLQRPLGRNDRPNRTAASEGRFLVHHQGFLDPAIYGPGRELTVAGEVTGRRSRSLDQIEYSYPVLSDKELVLWSPRREPGLRFGIGIGGRF